MIINTNYCHISVCKTKNKNKIIILSADNLIKGGAGQAIQNLNTRYNFPIVVALHEINQLYYNIIFFFLIVHLITILLSGLIIIKRIYH